MKNIKNINLILTISFIIIAVIFSEILIYIQLSLFWGKEYNEIAYSLGFWTPLIDSAVVITLILYLKSFYEKELKEKNTILEITSITDDLTEVYNRRYFNKILPKFINSAKRNKDIVSLLIIDIDHFKEYNDTYGHQAGDEVLIKVANSIKNTLQRADDFCFRIGGEEFAVIFKIDSNEKGLEFANIIRENIENLSIEHKNNYVSEYLTISIGVSCECAHNIEDENDFFKQADNLLYKAKKNGKNRVEHSF